MKRTDVLFTLTLLGILVLGTAVFAGVPTMMNYQGRLTDIGGDPVADGTYNVTFAIYDQLNTQHWTESHTVTTTDGLFSVILGSNGTSLTEDVFGYDECWLGITVGSDPEITSRTRLITTPYAFRTGTVDSAKGGTITSEVTINSRLKLGNPSADGDLYIYQNGYANPVVTAGNNDGKGGKLLIHDRNGEDVIRLGANRSGEGGRLLIHNKNGEDVITLETDGSGEGGRLTVMGYKPSQFFRVEGNYLGFGNPRVYIYGNESNIDFNTNNAGDSSVKLPNGAINSYEILNEPGIASESSRPTLLLTNVMQDIETVTITIPSAGYILVQGQCFVNIGGDIDVNYMYFQIDQTSGGSLVSPYYNKVGASEYATRFSFYSYSVFVQRVYFKATAGTYTFRLEGQKAQIASHIANAYNAIVTALYIPTSYGTVDSYVSDPAGFENAVPIEMVIDDDNPSVTETMYEVDLRELELRVARIKAAALEAEKALYKAQSQQNLDDQSE